MAGQLIDVMKNPLDQTPSRLGIVERDVIRDGVEIAQRRLGLDYFSHLAMRCLACAFLFGYIWSSWFIPACW